MLVASSESHGIVIKSINNRLRNFGRLCICEVAAAHGDRNVTRQRQSPRGAWAGDDSGVRLRNSVKASAMRPSGFSEATAAINAGMAI